MSSTDSLLEDARRVLPKLRSSFARVLTCLPGHIRRPCDISRELGIHQTLAWKIVQVIEAKDPFAAAQYVPGTEGVNIFLEAALRRTAPRKVVEGARAAVEEYRKLIKQHAGDRASLELMLGASARDGRSQSELTYRKAGFQCASYTWGVQACTRLLTMIWYSDPDPLLMRVANVLGYVNLRRVRPQSPWMLWTMSVGVFVDDGGRTHNTYSPIDSEGVGPNGIALLREFSTVPPNQIERVVVEPGVIEDVWVDGPLGDKAAITCFTGFRVEGRAARYADDQNPCNESGCQIRTPVEVLVMDTFVHRGLYGRIQPQLAVYSALGGRPWFDIPQLEREQKPTLPASETVEYLGPGSSAIHTPDVPRYEDMMGYVFRKLDWDIEACDLYRLRMVYPVMATSVVIRFPTPRQCDVVAAAQPSQRD